MRRAALTVLLVIFALGCGGTRVSSVWETNGLQVDGVLDEWEGQLTSVRGTSVALGSMNDAQSLYIAIRIDDSRSIGQAVLRGLEVWMDPVGGEQTHYGVKYPLGAEGRAGRLLNRGREAGNMGSALSAVLASQSEIEIMGPGKGDIRRRALSGTDGMTVSSSIRKGVFGWEIRVPLGRSDNGGLSIDAEPGSEVGVRIKTPKLDMASVQFGRGQRGGRPGGMGRGGMRGGGGRRPGGGTSGSGGQRPSSPTGLNIWTKITLAEGDKN